MLTFGFSVTFCLFIFSVYAISKMKPRWLRIDTSVWRFITFRMELGQAADKPNEAGGELEIKPDHLRQLLHSPECDTISNTRATDKALFLFPFSIPSTGILFMRD